MVDEEIGMPARRELSMRQLRHLLRLRHEGVSAREIGRRLGVARSTIQDNLKRAAAAGLKWPLGEEVTDDALELKLFGRAGVSTGQRRRVEPDLAELARELKRPGVTMTILWEEYREAHPGGYGYSRFCDLLRGFERRLTPVMRQHHVAGDKAFVDYSGKRISIVDPTTGEIREAEIFVGVLGASNLTYAEATWTQQLPDWTGAHVRMFRFFGGAPKLLVPDNLKSGVNKASFYDPEINRTYGAMAAHYGVGILPARPGKPRDKAKVEAGVRFAQTYILGRLRRLTFFSLAECNEAIALVMQRMNDRPMRNLGLSRRELFEKIERDALNALPADDWEFAEWRRARVNLDYHIEVHDFLYSVPHALIRVEVEVRITARTVEIFHRGQRVGICMAKVGSLNLQRDKAVDNGGLRYGAIESALRPPLPTATPSLRDNPTLLLSIGTQKGPPIGVQKGPLSWRIGNDRAESGRCPAPAHRAAPWPPAGRASRSSR
jgi:transposase